MSRLPTVGGDDNTWGNILNDFLDQAHNADGTLQGSAVSAAGAEMTSNKGSAGGYAPLDNTGKVPSANLPAITDSNAVHKGDLLLNVKDYGATGNGSTDDTTAIQSAVTQAITNISSGGPTIVYFPRGTYLVSQINVSPSSGNQLPALIGEGPEKSVISAKVGSAGPIISIAPSSQMHHLRLEHLYVNMNAVSAVAISIDNVDLSYINEVKTRGGTVGLDLYNVDSSTFIKVVNFNATTAGIRLGGNGGGGIPQGDTFIDCFQYATSSASSDIAALIELTNGYDLIFVGNRGYRTPGISHKVSKGLYIHPAALQSVFAFFTDCEWDGISTLSSDDPTCAAVWLQNSSWVKFKDCWASANSSTDGTTSQAIYISNCNDIDYDGGWVSGRGVVFDSAAASDSVIFRGAQFSSGNTTGMFIMPATNPPTNLYVNGCRRDHGVNGQSIPISNDINKLYTALDVRSDFFGFKPRPSRTSGCLYDEPDIVTVNNNSSLALVSGTIYGFAMWLPAGLTVSNATFFSGATALALGTSPHQWAGFADSSFVMQAVSADDTTGGWSANASKTFSFTSTYITKSDGLHFLILMINSGTGGTQPTLSSAVGLSAVAGNLTRRQFTAQTSQTTPPATPFTLTGMTNISQSPYRYIQ